MKHKAEKQCDECSSPHFGLSHDSHCYERMRTHEADVSGRTTTCNAQKRTEAHNALLSSSAFLSQVC